jgi:adenine deaminase
MTKRLIIIENGTIVDVFNLDTFQGDVEIYNLHDLTIDKVVKR